MQIDRQKHTELVKADSCSFRQFINTYTIYFANRSDELSGWPYNTHYEFLL